MRQQRLPGSFAQSFAILNVARSFAAQSFLRGRL